MTKIDTSAEAIAKLLDGVTPGPWVVDEGNSYCDVTTDYGVFGEDFVVCEHANKDARFIAAARDLVPAITADRDAMRAENERLRAKVEQAESRELALVDALITIRDKRKQCNRAVDCQAVSREAITEWEAAQK